MIIPVNGYNYANDFASIYNSANTLFQECERCDADETTFYRQFKEDNNFIYTDGNEVCGFMSWHKFEQYYELTSLYVKMEYQRTKIGHDLLTYFEEQIRDDSYTIIKVLNNAHWAMNFYKKHGYETINDEMRNLIQSWNMTEKPWEKILFKKSPCQV